MVKKKILITTDCYLPRWDGVARFLSELIPKIKDQFDITVIAPRFEGKPHKIEGIKTIKLPILPIRFGDIYFSFKTKEIPNHVAEADLVFNQTIGPIGAKAINQAHKQNKPIINYVHSIDWELASRAIKHFKWPAEKYVKKRAQNLYNKCNLLLVPSKETQDILTAHNIKSKKTIIEIGIDPEKFMPPASKAKAKKALKIPEKYTIIGFAGRIGREKDINTLAQAFLTINKKHPNTLLLIVGGGLLNEIPSHIKIIKTGPKENILPYLQAMDIYVLPSLTETTSISTLEAMSTELAVIGTPVGIIRKHIKDRENGMIFPRGDVNMLIDKINTLLENPELVKKMGEKARETIKQTSQWEETASKIKRVLEKV